MSALSLPLLKRRVKDPDAKIGLVGRVKLAVFQLLGGHVGGLAAVGGYFAVTQLLHGQHTMVFNHGVTFPDVKYFWDHLIDAPLKSGGLVNVVSHSQWTAWRHLVRPLYEGIFGGLLFAFVKYNPLKIRRNTNGVTIVPTWAAKIEHRLHLPTMYHKVTSGQIAALPLTVTLYSIPGVAIGIGVDRLLRLVLHAESLAPALAAHPSVVDKFYTSDFDAKVIGLTATLLGARRPAKPVFNFVLRYFAMRRALAGKRCHIYHPPAFKNLVKHYQKQDAATITAEQLGRHTAAIHLIMPSVLVTVIGLAGLGYYVLRFVA